MTTELTKAAQQALEAWQRAKYAQPQLDPAVDHAMQMIEDTLTQRPEAQEEWPGQSDIASPFNACQHKSYCMQIKTPPQQAAPEPSVTHELLDAMSEVIRISDRQHEAWDKAKAAISMLRGKELPAPTPEPVGEPVAIIGTGWTFLWASGDAMEDIVKRHGLKIGTKLYTRPAPAAQAALMTEAWFDSAMRLADAYADACFDQALNQRTEDPNPEAKREKLVEHLRHHRITGQAKEVQS